MRTNNNGKFYTGMTLIETLITLLIVGLVLLVVSATLTALIKASAISAARTLSRNESEFVLELLDRYLRNSQSEQIYLYDVPSGKRYVAPNGSIVDNEAIDMTVVTPNTNTPASEVHVRPIRSDKWICLAYYEGQPGTEYEGRGFIIRNLADSQSPGCMLGGGHVFLTSDDVDVNSLSITASTTSSSNFIFVVDLNLEPVHWVPGSQSRFKPEYIRQLVVSTERLTF